MTKQSITVVRDWHPVRRAVAAGAMSVVLASAMALPAFAATGVDYNVGDTDYSKTEAFTDDANGISWDGKDAITLNNANLDGMSIDGNASIQLEGESNLGVLYVDAGNLALVGDDAVPAEDKPILNIVGEEFIPEEGETATDGGIYVFATYNDDSEIIEGGNLVVSGLTLNFTSVYGTVFASGDVTIDNSKVAVDDVDNKKLRIGSGGTMDIVESVVDLGTQNNMMGGVAAGGLMTINNSDVTVRASDNLVEMLDEFGMPFMGVRSDTDIKLVSEANGEVKYYGEGEYKQAYVDTGDKNGVFLKAASTPGYYTGKAAAKAMPKTGDAVNTGVFAGMAALAAGALGALGLSRKNRKHEA